MYHYPIEFIPEGKNSAAYYSADPPKNLVVFVHGFRGASVETWNDFANALPLTPGFCRSDIIYYGYDSMEGQAFDQAADFLAFLDRHSTPRSALRPDNPPVYEKIIICAHSLGSIVARFALLESIKAGFAWRKQCKLVLFAPAHNGARVQSLLMLSLPGFYKVLGSLLMYNRPVIDDLRPGSPALVKLESETQKYRDTGEAPILSAQVLHAFGDKVVHNAPFCYDTFCTGNPVRGRSHVSICKPEMGIYDTPIQIIEALL
ncbi:hypothetical protein [Taibaiella chishuiensis]|uniref:Putative serine esterase DUF676 n=1 Tax=Taibaiella chishuiensis TaxID=1434707 RepID=A0A2P8D209_9BACT|nr:hypothetical protein [Taibaiella chishuiensis]PSK91237.1 putative serine esterase DUF676 [Taibaiella chishuiensis]